MILKPNFEIVDIVDEYLAVPVGEEAKSFNGVVALSEAASFLLKNMNTHKSKEDLVALLIDEYDIQESVAQADIEGFIEKMLDLGLIQE